MHSCSICYAWQPVEFNGLGYSDKKAPCTYFNMETLRTFICPHFSIIPPENKKQNRSGYHLPKVAAEREEETTYTLFEHQKRAIEKYKDLDTVALFFEMGCGKTLTCMMIAADKFKQGKIDSLLVVAPNDVHKQWFDDLCNDDSVLSKMVHEQCGYTVQIIGGRGGQKVFYDFDDTDSLLHIVCTNIDTFSTPHKWEAIRDWANAHNTMIVIDEATVIKNPSSKRAQRMLYEFNIVVKHGRAIKASVPRCPVRAVLTGTPVSNGPMDLWAIMEFLSPNYFDRNYYSFMNYYGMHTKLSVPDGHGGDRTISVLLTEKTWRGIKDCADFGTAAATFGCSEDTYLTVQHQDKFTGPYKHADELRAKLDEVAVFAKLVDCVDMPATHYITRNIPMSEAQTAVYNNLKAQLIAQYAQHEVTAKNKMVLSLRLQQVSSGFIMGRKLDLDMEDINDVDFNPDEVVWLDDKLPKMEALLRDIDELDRPLLIMTRFSAEASKLYDKLSDKYSTCLITGWKCIGSIDEFKQGKYDIMIANLAKIARGYNLQIAHTTLYYSNTFSMELRQQSEFRTFRIGQTWPCTYVDYVSNEIDTQVLGALKIKKNLLEYIREKPLEEIG